MMKDDAIDMHSHLTTKLFGSSINDTFVATPLSMTSAMGGGGLSFNRRATLKRNQQRIFSMIRLCETAQVALEYLGSWSGVPLTRMNQNWTQQTWLFDYCNSTSIWMSLVSLPIRPDLSESSATGNVLAA